MGQKLVISEQEKKDIRKMYNLVNEQDYVFDFVLTENEKYLFIMDQVFVAGGDGKSIGNIWENTHILTEILNESLLKQNILTESNKEVIKNITWSKTLIKEWLKEKPIITEGWWNDLSKKFGSGIINMAKTLFLQGVVPFLRWVRKSLYTGIGIVVDVVVSILAAKTNAIVWILVCALDIYEILSGDFDPTDDRRQMPYVLLLCDLMGVVFSGGVALLFKKSANTIVKQGLKNASPTIIKYLKAISNKIPSLSNTLKSGINILNKKMGSKSTGFISTVLKGLDKILTGLSNFITKLFSKKGVKSVTKGGVVYGSTKFSEKGLDTNIGKKISNNILSPGLKNTENFFQNNVKSTALTQDQINDIVKQFQLKYNN